MKFAALLCAVASVAHGSRLESGADATFERFSLSSLEGQSQTQSNKLDGIDLSTAALGAFSLRSRDWDSPGSSSGGSGDDDGDSASSTSTIGNQYVRPGVEYQRPDYSSLGSRFNYNRSPSS